MPRTLTQVCIVNAYFQTKGWGETYRPAVRTLWDGILAECNCEVAEDFNAPRPQRNRGCTKRRDATFLEDLMGAFKLEALNNQ